MTCSIDIGSIYYHNILLSDILVNLGVFVLVFFFTDDVFIILWI